MAPFVGNIRVTAQKNRASVVMREVARPMLGSCLQKRTVTRASSHHVE
jgi:hypothetical protein